ncbi:MAG: hypothetical protein MUF38_16570 [Anaerolineae bacterium]|nr:hypothetical protein [Anaerolineae bacterium]
MSIPGRSLRAIVLIWLAWSVIIIGYMSFAPQRYAPSRADEALSWSANETRRDSLDDNPYLLDPFLNTQAAWDSEYYLSIAQVGYEDPDISTIEVRGETYSKSYAFFPLYPFAMKVLRAPLTLFDMTPIAASTLAGVLVSLLGALAAMVALHDITRDELGEEGGIRTAFMLLIFPASFFFATVYTEGLFVGLAFSSLALMRRRRLIPAAILAMLATWTRAVGGTLIVPLGITWLMMYMQTGADRRGLWLRAPLVALPLVAYGIFRIFNGEPFEVVEVEWFGNRLFDFGMTFDAWGQILTRAQEFPETAAWVALNLGAIIIAVVSLFVGVRRYPMLALFGFVSLLVPLSSGWTGTQSAFRYVLAVPTLWVMLGRFSRSVVFDRAWTTASILLLAMNAFLFSFDFWAG